VKRPQVNIHQLRNHVKNSEELKKKLNFTQCEVEVIIGEVEKRRKMLFGGHSVGT